MAKLNCDNCNSWTVRGANFCHNCGHSLSLVFEYSQGNGGPQMAQNGMIRSNWKDRVATTILIVSTAGIGAIVGVLDTGYMVLVPLAYLLWEPASKLILDILGKLPDKPPKALETTLRVEHKTPDNKHWRLYDFPAGIELAHIQHIARICLEPPTGEGAAFSRRKVKRNGALSQGQFETISQFFLDVNYAFYRDNAAPNLGIVLTERCNRLLKKALNS